MWRNSIGRLRLVGSVEGVPFVLLVLVAMFPFLGVLSAGFVWDDFPQLLNNPRFALGDLPDYWLQSESRTAGIGRPSAYHPLGWSIWLLDSVISAGARPPWLYHLTSLLAHGLATGLLAALMMAAGRVARDPIPRGVVILSVLWFAWSPIQAEAVCFCSALFDPLALVLVLAGALILVRASGISGSVVGGLVMAGSLLAKETPLPLIFLLPVGLAWLLGSRRLLWGCLGSIVGLALVVGLRAGIGVPLPGTDNPGAVGAPLMAVFSTWLELLRMALLQPSLSILRPYVASPTAVHLAVFGLLMLFLGGSLVQRSRFHGRMAFFGGGWLLFGMLPSALAGAQYQLLPDRYVYLAVPGISFMMAAIILAARSHLRPFWTRVIQGAVVVVVVTFVVRDVAQTSRWKDSIALFTWERVQRPDTAQASFYLGLAYVYDDRPVEAEEAFSSAARLDPSRVQVWTQLARVQAAQGRISDAMGTLRQGLVHLPQERALQEMFRRLRVEAGRRSQESSQ